MAKERGEAEAREARLKEDLERKGGEVRMCEERKTRQRARGEALQIPRRLASLVTNAVLTS